MKSRKGYGGHQGHLLSPVGSPPSDNESGAAAAAATGGGGGCGSSVGYYGGGGESPAKEQDRFLPIANVSRIMKRSLPANAKISKEAKETVQECVSEFISFVTGEASDKCQREKRKTINGDDLLWAMTTLGFEAYVAPLKSYLNRYREAEGEKAAVLGAGGGARHGDGAADDGTLAAAGVVIAPPSGAAGDRAVHDGAAGHDAHVGLMMGASSVVGFGAGGAAAASYYTAARKSYHYYRFKHHCRPITAGLYWAGSDKSSLPVQTLTDIQMIGVGVKPAVKLIITAGSWLESAVKLHYRFVAGTGSDNELHCRFVAGTGSDNTTTE